MPRWPIGHVTTRTCPECGGRKDFYATVCRRCYQWQKPLLGKKGPDHPAWKGGQMIDRDGYIKLYLPDHPWPRRGGYVLEHVAVMELELGRRISPHECVHHRDGDRQNNVLDNLEIMERGAHTSHHAHLRRHAS